MAGHSKWKNIRLRKGKQDAIRGKLFTKLSREIIIAARAGGGDAETNARLRVAIAKAKENSVPAENIKRAVDRGTGVIPGADYEELTYEGYGPGGSAVILEVYTENRNRTVAEVRHAFSKHGGSLAENGSVMWQFKHLGEITVSKGQHDSDEFELAAIEAGADDVQIDDEDFTVYTAVEDLHRTNDALMKAGYEASEVALTFIATNKANPSEADMPKILRLLEALDDLDDVQETYVNVDISEDMYEDD